MSFDSIQLKKIAFILMIIDHIALFIPNVPIYFRWLGRISMPLFLFCCVWGFDYTSNRKKYILRLYIFSIITSVVQCIYNIDNNFILTMFSITVLLEVIELSKNNPKTICYYIVWQIFAVVASLYLMQTSSAGTETVCFYVIPALMGSVFFLEGGFIYVVLGLFFYYFKDDKKKLAVSFLVFDGIFFVCTQFSIVPRLLYKLPYISINGMGSIQEILFFIVECMGLPEVGFGDSPLFENFQWMMIFSLPFMLLYNEKTRKVGKVEKMFYYWAYPIHLLLLNLH